VTRAALLLLAAATSAAAADVPSTRELAEMSLEQLAHIEITSVSRKPERLADAPASVFVITADDIRRAGATSLPEALRLAPNLQVAQASATTYNIQARGFNNTSANKLLVLIDGRSVYSPLFSGVFWDVQDVVLADIDRIEVVSGPGGTLWGVNAVNGVINVVTKSAAETQGGLLAASGGNRESRDAARHGGSLGANGHYRVYGEYLDLAHTSTANGTAIRDGAYKSQAGFRADWATAQDEVMFQGNAYRGLIGQPEPGTIAISGVSLELEPIPVSGVNTTARWARRLAGGSEAVLQAYWDRTERTVHPTVADKQDIADLQFQHAIRWMSHSLVWGGEYRYGRDRVTNGDVFAFLPADVNQKWASVFAQDETALTHDLRLIVGARLEHNDYTGNEFLPTARLAWKPAADHMLWAAASRTVRAPSRLDRDAFVPAQPPFLLQGGPDVQSEVAKVYELGYRGQPWRSVSYSITGYHSDFDRLHTQEVDPTFTHINFAGMMEGQANGVEMWASWQAMRAWRLMAGYTAQHETFHLEPGSNDAGAVATAGRDPAFTWLVRSSLNVNPQVDFDVTVRAVARLSDPDVPGYVATDVRIGWRPRRDMELSLAARDLGGGHGEFTSEATRTEIKPGYYASIRWNFDAR
jgi:iron complex outermembrane receptor protein